MKKGVLLAMAAPIGVLLLGCGDASPDQVVGVTLKCEISVTSRVGGETNRELKTVTGPQCEPAVPAAGQTPTTNRTVRREVTVRTSKGDTYVVEVPLGQVVEVGDRWPPTR